MSRPISFIERLEGRALLSTSVSAVPITPMPPITAPVLRVYPGATLYLTAGQAFSGRLGFFPSPVIDPPLGLRPTVNWGDGKISPATWAYGQNGKAFGIFVSGTHTYAHAGVYAIVVELTLSPINPKMAIPSQLLGQIDAKAFVNSPGGRTIHETATKPFTAVLGIFGVPISMSQGLRAMINWGDGKSIFGELKLLPTANPARYLYEVIGTHTYAKPGTYRIHIVITRPGPTPTTLPLPVTTIDSTAVVGPTPIAT